MPGSADMAGCTFFTTDPGGTGRVWRVCWHGTVLPLSWPEPGPAEELLELLRRTGAGGKPGGRGTA